MDSKISVVDVAINCIKENKNFIIQGGAGSGKTESLKQLLNRISTEFDNKKVICITHTNVAADEIKSRTQNMYEVSTIHTFLYSLVGKYKKNIKDILFEIYKVPSLEEYCQEKNKEQIDHDVYKKVHEKYWKKNNKINPKNYVAEVEDKRKYSSNSELYNKILDEKIIQLNNQIKSIIQEQCDYTKIKYNQNKFDSLKSFSYGHDSLLKIASILIKKYPKLVKIINDKYDLILIDEYQDTNKEVLDTFINYVSNEKTVIGLFGDEMQAIYKDGIGDVNKFVLDGKIKKIQKMDNFRCSQQVVNFLNAIRSDLKQEIVLKNDEKIEDRQGKVRVYYKIYDSKPNSRAGREEKEKYNSLLDLTVNEVVQDIGYADNKYKVLLLSNGALSKKLHFEKLYNIFSEKYVEVKDEIEKKATTMGWFDLVEMYLYFKDEQYKNHNELVKVLKRNGFIISNQKDKNAILNVFNQIDPNTYKIKDVFDILDKNNMYKKELNENRNSDIKYMKAQIKVFEKDKDLKTFIDNYSKGFTTITKIRKAEIDITQEDFENYRSDMIDFNFYKNILEEDIKFSEIIQYKKYLDEKLQYLTMHKTKGSSLDNVILILDEYFWITDYNFEKMIKKEESTTLENSNKLFYVACSRAKQDLTIIRIIKPDEESVFLQFFNKDICEVKKLD